jgi:hypothetical protein
MEKNGEFPPVENKYALYAKVSPNEKTILVRGSINDEYPVNGWPVSMAREYAQYINHLADEVERNSETVKDLVADLETADLALLAEFGEFQGSWEGIAIQLARMGYRK